MSEQAPNNRDDTKSSEYFGEEASAGHNLRGDLSRLVVASDGKGMTLGTFVDSLGDRSHAVVIIILTTPFLFIPLPGLSTPIGAVLLLFGAAVAVNRRPWLPKRLRARHISHDLLTKIVSACNRVLAVVEKLVKPRLLAITSGPGHFLTGLSLIAAIVALALPIPIPYNNAPPAVVILILAFGLLERDGIAVLIGHILTILMWTILIVLGGWLLSESYDLLMKLLGYMGIAGGAVAPATMPSTLPTTLPTTLP